MDLDALRAKAKILQAQVKVAELREKESKVALPAWVSKITQFLKQKPVQLAGAGTAGLLGGSAVTQLMRNQGPAAGNAGEELLRGSLPAVSKPPERPAAGAAAGMLDPAAQPTPPRAVGDTRTQNTRTVMKHVRRALGNWWDSLDRTLGGK